MFCINAWFRAQQIQIELSTRTRGQVDAKLKAHRTCATASDKTNLTTKEIQIASANPVTDYPQRRVRCVSVNKLDDVYSDEAYDSDDLVPPTNREFKPESDEDRPTISQGYGDTSIVSLEDRDDKVALPIDSWNESNVVNLHVEESDEEASLYYSYHKMTVINKKPTRPGRVESVVRIISPSAYACRNIFWLLLKFLIFIRFIYVILDQILDV